MQKLIFFIGLLISFQPLSAQSGFVPYAGQNQGSNGRFTYSVGQLFYKETIGNNASFNPGLQQPFEITVITATNDLNWDISINVFPNPADDYLHIQFPDINPEGISYHLLDISGKTLFVNNLLYSDSTLDMFSRPAGTYILTFANQNKQRKSYKIVKK